MSIGKGARSTALEDGAAILSLQTKLSGRRFEQYRRIVVPARDSDSLHEALDTLLSDTAGATIVRPARQKVEA